MKFVLVALLCLASFSMSLQTPKNDVAQELEDFLVSFWTSAFDIKLDLDLCDGEVHKSLSVIGEALDMIHNTTDGVISTYYHAYLHVKENADLFHKALIDCEATGPEFLAGLEKLKPMLDVGAASIAISKAALHSPWTFPANALRAKSAFSSGDMKACGSYAGADLKLILLEFQVSSLKLVTEFEQFMEAFWFAAFDIELHLNGCTTGSEDAWTAIEKVMYLISDRSDPIEIAVAIQYIVSHYDAFTQAFDQCSGAMSGLVDGVVQLTWFEDAEGAAYYFSQALKSHPMGFMLNVKRAQSAFSEGRYADAGKYLGTDLHWMIDEIPEEPELKLVEEFEQFTEAFWLAAFDIKLELNGCTSGSEEAIEVISKVMSLISADPLEMIQAIQYIATHLSSFEAAFSSCSGSAKGIYEGIVQITWFEDAEGAAYYFSQALKSHPMGFMLNVKRAQSAFSEGRFADAGKYLGTDVHWMIEEIPDEPELRIVQEFEQFMEAFWLAAFDVKLELNGCTTGSEDAFLVVQHAISMFSASPLEMLEAIEYIATHLSAFPKAFNTCQSSAKGIYEGIVQITWFEDADGAVYYFEQALKDHPLGFMLNIKRAQSAFSEGRYADAGKYLGTDVHWMIDEIPDEPVKL